MSCSKSGISPHSEQEVNLGCNMSIDFEEWVVAL
jgi:hypothetical protein